MFVGLCIMVERAKNGVMVITDEDNAYLSKHFDIPIGSKNYSSMYKVILDSFISNDNSPIPTEFLNNTKLITYLMIANAEKEILIYSDKYNTQLYDDPLIKETLLDKVFDGDVKVRVILKNKGKFDKFFKGLDIPVRYLDLKNDFSGLYVDSGFMLCDKSNRCDASYKKKGDNMTFVGSRSNFNVGSVGVSVVRDSYKKLYSKCHVPDKV